MQARAHFSVKIPKKISNICIYEKIFVILQPNCVHMRTSARKSLKNI